MTSCNNRLTRTRTHTRLFFQRGRTIPEPFTWGITFLFVWAGKGVSRGRQRPTCYTFCQWLSSENSEPSPQITGFRSSLWQSLRLICSQISSHQATNSIHCLSDSLNTLLSSANRPLGRGEHELGGDHLPSSTAAAIKPHYITSRSPFDLRSTSGRPFFIHSSSPCLILASTLSVHGCLLVFVGKTII